MQKLNGPISTKVLSFTFLAVLSSAMVVCGRSQAAAPPAPPEVRVASVVQQDDRVYCEWVATLDRYVNAQVRPLRIQAIIGRGGIGLASVGDST